MNTQTANLYYCFICNDRSPESVTPQSIEVAAFKAGWMIKLYKEQAKAICPNCTNLVLDLIVQQPEDYAEASERAEHY